MITVVYSLSALAIMALMFVFFGLSVLACVTVACVWCFGVLCCVSVLVTNYWGTRNLNNKYL